MGFIQKDWTNPVSANATELNRIEKGIKDSHDNIKILSEELANLQLKQIKNQQDIQTLISNSPSVLETVENLTNLVSNNASLIQTLQDTSNLVTHSQLNSKLNTFLHLTDIKQNGHSIVNGSEVNINSTIVDNFLEKASTNAISNKAVAQALENIASKLVIPTKLSDLNQDSTHLLVTQEEKNLWNAIGNQQLSSEETDTTVPEWAKQPTKPEYEWTEILYKPAIKNFISEFPDVTNYALSTHNHDGIYSLLSHNHDTSYAALLHNHDTDYAAISHTHTEFSSIVDSTRIQSMIDTSIASLINGAPTTLDTLKELADAIGNNAGLISALDAAVSNHNHDSQYAPLSHTHSNYASNSHTHTVSNITDIATYYSGINHDHDTLYAALNHNHDSTYLKLSGGTMTGAINASGDLKLQSSNQIIRFGISSDASSLAVLAGPGYYFLRPGTNNTFDLGTSSQKWKNLYLSGGLKDGNNSNYTLKLPNTTSWTADKTIATADQIPANHVTTDTTQSISGQKTFTGNIYVPDVTIS